MHTPLGAAAGIPGSVRNAGTRLPPDVTRILLVRNLPFKITAENLYEVFGAFGTIRQLRMSNAQETKGSAFVIFDDIFDAKNAVDKLSGHSVMGRYEKEIRGPQKKDSSFVNRIVCGISLLHVAI